MAVRYCIYCQRLVNARRHIGILSWLMILFIFGLWLLAIPFYRQRCPICGGTDFLDHYPRFQSKRKAPAPEIYGKVPQEDESDYTHRLFGDEIIDLTIVVPHHNH